MVIPLTQEELAMLQYKYTQFDFPLIEYRPFRSFSTNQSSSMAIQFSLGFDHPHNLEVIAPEGTESHALNTIWYVGLRFAFDWRYYW